MYLSIIWQNIKTTFYKKTIPFFILGLIVGILNCLKDDTWSSFLIMETIIIFVNIVFSILFIFGKTCIDVFKLNKKFLRGYKNKMRISNGP